MRRTAKHSSSTLNRAWPLTPSGTPTRTVEGPRRGWSPFHPSREVASRGAEPAAYSALHCVGMETSRRRLVTVLGLLLASLFCVGLVVLRIIESGSSDFSGLIWNLFLAWIPFALAVAVYDGWRRKRARGTLVVLGALWLLFFPNAPYIVTDFVHLERTADAPYWYDAVTVSAFAWTGVLLGFASLFLMQTVVRQSRGVVIGWIFAAVALAPGLLGI